MDYGFEATVKRKPLETGPKYEFHTGYLNAYPIANDGYNKFFDVSLKAKRNFEQKNYKSRFR